MGYKIKKMNATLTVCFNYYLTQIHLQNSQKEYLKFTKIITQLIVAQ